jgi:hypothetical protein
MSAIFVLARRPKGIFGQQISLFIGLRTVGVGKYS